MRQPQLVMEIVESYRHACNAPSTRLQFVTQQWAAIGIVVLYSQTLD